MHGGGRGPEVVAAAADDAGVRSGPTAHSLAGTTTGADVEGAKGTRTGRGRGEDEDERTRGRSRDLLEFGSCGRVDGHPGRSTGVGRGSWLLGVGLALAPEKEGERRASHER